MEKQTKEIVQQVEEYAGLPYTMTVEQRNEQGVYYVARFIELPGLVMTGSTPQEAVAELEVVKREWMQSYLELGNKMPLPLKSRRYSGQISLRIPPTLHAELDQKAHSEEVSLNQLMVAILASGANRPSVAEDKLQFNHAKTKAHS